jgi:imidazolonepropionase-like amidohydrolase
VRTQKAAGYDMIKAHSRISAESYDRLVQAARAARMAVVGHHIPEIGLARQLAAGQVSFEHYNDLGPIDEAARSIASAGAWVGTIIIGVHETCGSATDTDRRIFAAFKRANVKLLAGTDASLGPIRASDALHCELQSLVSAGLTPYEALSSATSNAGAFMQAHGPQSLPPFGTVTVGSRADLVLLAADPRVSISAVREPAAIVLRGRVVRDVR